MSIMAAERQTILGAFVFGGLVLIVGAIVLFGNIDVFSPTRRAVIVFQGSVSGLSVGAPVTFRGVQVGAVDSVVLQFDPESQAAYIPVTVQLQSNRVHVLGDGSTHFQALDLPALGVRGLRAELNSQSFVTGQAEI